METEVIQPDNLNQRSAPLKPGTPLCAGRYHVAGILGSGGFGITYLAVATATGRRVAIKEFFYKAEHLRAADGRTVTAGVTSGTADVFRAKFRKEASMLKALDHKGIVRVSETFSENGTEYYVMDYIVGAPLAQVIKEKGAMSPGDARRIINAVSEALSYLHARRITHLDLKPSNIILDAVSGLPVLIDFGVSKHYDNAGNHTTSSPAGISAGYSALEQYSAQGADSFSPESDVYSLAATLYAMVTGTPPPDAATVALNGLPELPDRLPQAIRDAISSGMRPRRQERPSSVLEWVNILNRHTTDRITPQSSPQSIPQIKHKTPQKTQIPRVITPVAKAPKANKKRRSGCLKWFIIAFCVAFAATVVIITLQYSNVQNDGARQVQLAPEAVTTPDDNVKENIPATNIYDATPDAQSEYAIDTIGNMADTNPDDIDSLVASEYFY